MCGEWARVGGGALSGHTASVPSLRQALTHTQASPKCGPVSGSQCDIRTNLLCSIFLELDRAPHGAAQRHGAEGQGSEGRGVVRYLEKQRQRC